MSLGPPNVIQLPTPMYGWFCLHVPPCVYDTHAYVYTSVHSHAHILTYTLTHTYSFMYFTHTLAYTHISHTHTRTCIYAHIYTYTHTYLLMYYTYTIAHTLTHSHLTCTHIGSWQCRSYRSCVAVPHFWMVCGMKLSLHFAIPLYWACEFVNGTAQLLLQTCGMWLTRT